MGTIYLIHFDKPLKHAQHYIGYVNGSKKAVTKRMNRHIKGDGAKLLRAVTLSGIQWSKVRLWYKVTRSDERYLKNKKKSKSMCPICNKDYRKYGILPISSPISST